MISKNSEAEEVKLQQQIQRIFTCVALHEKLNQRALEKVRQLMMLNIKQIAGEALDRSICRDGTSTQLEPRDLLAVIQSRGDIYKFKIVRTFLMNKTRSQLSQKPQKDVKTIKQADFDDKDDNKEIVDDDDDD